MDDGISGRTSILALKRPGESYTHLGNRFTNSVITSQAKPER